MDISEISIPETVEIHIEFPGMGKLYADDDKTTPSIIEMYGPSSDQAVAHKRKLMRQVQSQIAKKGMKGIGQGDPEEQEIDRLCALTARVSGLTYKGESITRDTIRKVYADQKMGWIKDQLLERIGSWEDFLAGA